jgi:hypothetical protein
MASSEKTRGHEEDAIQALDRLDPALPLSPGRAERHGFEYYRYGTLSLYGHTSDAFVDFLGDVVATQSRRREIHVIVPNLSAHRTRKVPAFLDAYPRV